MTSLRPVAYGTVCNQENIRHIQNDYELNIDILMPLEEVVLALNHALLHLETKTILSSLFNQS